jgi:hypothetical protein
MNEILERRKLEKAAELMSDDFPSEEAEPDPEPETYNGGDDDDD